MRVRAHTRSNPNTYAFAARSPPNTEVDKRKTRFSIRRELNKATTLQKLDAARSKRNSSSSPDSPSPAGGAEKPIDLNKDYMVLRHGPSLRRRRLDASFEEEEPLPEEIVLLD